MEVLLWLLLFCPTYLCLRIVSLGVPESVLLGDPVWLYCDYDLEGDNLESVKWYQNDYEIYEFSPSYPDDFEDLYLRLWNLPGVFLDPRFSNDTHVYLNTSNLDTEGSYRCTVHSSGFKSINGVKMFRVRKAEKEKMLRVHVTPIEPPRIYNGGSRPPNEYNLGDLVNMSCVFGPSERLSRIIWYINEEEAPALSVFPLNAPPGTASPPLTTESRLSFVLGPRMHSVTCAAEVLQDPVVATIELFYELGKFKNDIHHFPAMGFPNITVQCCSIYEMQFNVRDNVDLNCFANQKPNHRLKLEWGINDEPVPPEMLSEDNGSNLVLHFYVTGKHWRRVSFKCTATMTEITKTCAHFQLDSGSLTNSTLFKKC